MGKVLVSSFAKHFVMTVTGVSSFNKRVALNGYFMTLTSEAVACWGEISTLQSIFSLTEKSYSLANRVASPQAFV